MRRILLIENPGSGQSDTDTSCLRKTCLNQGWELVQRPLDKECKFAELLADHASFAAIVGVGGDGTISGMAAELCGTGIPLLGWPGGTANLVAQNLFTDLKPETLCQALIDWQVCQLDMGVLSAGGRTQRFVMLAGAGTDARMIRDSEALKPDWGVAAYVKALLSQFELEPSRIKLTIDGELIDETSAVGVLVANLGKINFGLPMAHQIQGQDALLDVIVLKRLSSGMLLAEFWNAALRRLGAQAGNHEDISLYRGREISLETEPSMPLQYDGEPLDVSTPVSFRILPAALSVFGHPQALARADSKKNDDSN